jgi:hypothetical protein
VSLKQRVKLEIEGHDDVDVVFDGRDLRAWELRHKQSAMNQQVSFSFLTWCGWHAAKRQQLLTGLNGTGETYEKFDEICTSVEGLSDDDEAPDESDGADEGRPTKRPRKAATPRTPSDG